MASWQVRAKLTAAAARPSPDGPFRGGFDRDLVQDSLSGVLFTEPHSLARFSAPCLDGTAPRHDVSGSRPSETIDFFAALFASDALRIKWSLNSTQPP
jgi:hypothetical protein